MLCQKTLLVLKDLYEADRLNTAKFLIKTGAEVGCVDNHGRSAVHIAAHKGTIKFLSLLAQKGADFHLPDQVSTFSCVFDNECFRMGRHLYIWQLMPGTRMEHV